MTSPKCLTKNCECFAAKNKYYPNSEGGEFWTLCEKCYEEDQEEEEDMTTCYGCDELFDNDDLRGICQREDCKIHQWDDGCSDPRVLCKDCYVNNNPAAEEHEEEATTEFARNKICDECGCKGGCELTCVYVCGKKKPKKKKKRKRLVIVDKLCKSTPCQLIKDEEWNMKCSMCDGYYKDDGLHDILDVNDDENRSCKLCGNSSIDNLVIMKGTGSCVCARACEADEEEDLYECMVCGEEELEYDHTFSRLYGSVSMTFCKECYDNRL